MPKKLPVPIATNDNTIWHLFGSPPLLPGENSADFYNLLERLARDEKPTDTIEHGWVWDIAALTWEIGRYRRCIAGLYAVNRLRALKIILAPLYGDGDLPKLLDHWAERQADAISYVDLLLQRAGLAMEDVTAQTLSVKINDIERIEYLVTAKRAQLISLIREIGRRRAALGSALRQSVGEIEEGEFTEIGASNNETSSAA